MRKAAFVVAAVLGIGVFSGANASALDPVCTVFGCAGVDDSGYVIVLDGALGNPEPFDGYVGVTNGGVIACSAAGGPYSHPDPTTEHQPEDCPFV